MMPAGSDEPSSPPARMAASVDAEEPALPPSVAASGRSSVGAPRVSASSLSCNYLDQGTKTNLAESAWPERGAPKRRARSEGADARRA